MNKQARYRELHKSHINEAAKAWRKKNRHKCRAHRLLQKAVRLGIVKKPSVCEMCEHPATDLHGHHPDYVFPLAVLWVCRKCHSSIHGVCVGAIRTFHRGEKHGRAKLTERDVSDIRAQCQRGHAKRAIAREFGVSDKLIRLIMKGEIWV